MTAAPDRPRAWPAFVRAAAPAHQALAFGILRCLVEDDWTWQVDALHAWSTPRDRINLFCLAVELLKAEPEALVALLDAALTDHACFPPGPDGTAPKSAVWAAAKAWAAEATDVERRAWLSECLKAMAPADRVKWLGAAQRFALK